MQATLFDEGGGIVTGTHDTDTARRALREKQAEAMGLAFAEAAGDAELGDAAQWLDAEPKKGWGRWTRQPGETGSVYLGGDVRRLPATRDRESTMVVGSKVTTGAGQLH